MELGGQYPPTMRYRLHLSNHISWTPRPVACIARLMEFDKLKFGEQGTCPFLVSARKGRKEADTRGTELLAPASKAVPLCIPRPASPAARSNLTRSCFFRKCSDFLKKVRCLPHRQGGESDSRRQQQGNTFTEFRPLRCWEVTQVRAGWGT